MKKSENSRKKIYLKNYLSTTQVDFILLKYPLNYLENYSSR